ncbi:MAG: globin domain-containing protein [Candidatus Heimdallarchaeota archaeon]|nr:globin domain-containing protein [Candidatus Heimdallarchaeota archaeon]
MEITEHQIKLVQSTWEKVVPKSFEISQKFYGKLFEKYPNYKQMFKTDMREQGKKLMQMIGTTVLGLTNIGRVTPTLKESGIRHVGYGVTDDDYNKLKPILFWSFKDSLPDVFTDEVIDAWNITYDIISNIMIEGTKKEESIFMRVLKKTKFW